MLQKYSAQPLLNSPVIYFSVNSYSALLPHCSMLNLFLFTSICLQWAVHVGCGSFALLYAHCKSHSPFRNGAREGGYISIHSGTMENKFSHSYQKVRSEHQRKKKKLRLVIWKRQRAKEGILHKILKIKPKNVSYGKGVLNKNL